MGGVDVKMSFDIWSNFSGGIFEYSIDAYNGLEPWTYPIIFLAIIGYVFMATRSITAAIVSIFITMGIYATTTNIFVDVPDLTLFLMIVSLIGMSMLFIVLIMKVVDRI